MATRWMVGVVTLTVVLCLIGLLTFTVGSVRSVAQPARPYTEVQPPVEPEVGPTVEGNGLMVTY
jgi:hypothetical protein